MARTLTRLERLDDQHARAAMRAQMVVLLRERRVLAGSIIGWVLLRRRELGRSDQLASAGELLGARVTAIGEQAVVPDAVKALGQHVHEEPTHELGRLERHGCVPVRAFKAVVLVFERDAVRVGGDQAAVGDGDAMGVAG